MTTSEHVSRGRSSAGVGDQLSITDLFVGSCEAISLWDTACKSCRQTLELNPALMPNLSHSFEAMFETVPLSHLACRSLPSAVGVKLRRHNWPELALDACWKPFDMIGDK